MFLIFKRHMIDSSAQCVEKHFEMHFSECIIWVSVSCIWVCVSCIQLLISFREGRNKSNGETITATCPEPSEWQPPKESLTSMTDPVLPSLDLSLRYIFPLHLLPSPAHPPYTVFSFCLFPGLLVIFISSSNNTRVSKTQSMHTHREIFSKSY